MNPWFSRIGPLSWYWPKPHPPEWIRLEFTFRSIVLLNLEVKFRRDRISCIILGLGNRIVRRSIYGSPSAIEGGIHLVITGR